MTLTELLPWVSVVLMPLAGYALGFAIKVREQLIVQGEQLKECIERLNKLEQASEAMRPALAELKSKHTTLTRVVLSISKSKKMNKPDHITAPLTQPADL